MDSNMTSLALQDAQYAIINLMPKLKRFARTLTKSADVAEDLVQTAYMRALSHPTSIAEIEQLAKWMRFVILNIWIDEKRSARSRLSEPLESDDHYAATDDTERTVIARTTLARVRTELARMPEGQRSVLVLVCIEGLSYKQVATELGIPVGTVMSRLHRGRLELAQRISLPSQNADTYTRAG
jgi:RNA polymerase sigma-70 factor (ECF subfamily)